MNNFNFPIKLNGFSVASGANLMFKIGFLVANLFIIIFLLVVLRQVFSMDHIIHDSNDSMFIKTFTFILLFAAISLFLISLAIL
jgi:hypothetical protein